MFITKAYERDKKWFYFMYKYEKLDKNQIKQNYPYNKKKVSNITATIFLIAKNFYNQGRSVPLQHKF